MRIMKEKLLFLVNNLEEIFCGAAISITILSTVFNIVSGAIFNKRFGQCEELATSAFVWITFVGVSLGYKKATHICIDFIVNALPKKIQDVVELFIKAILLVFSLIVAYYAAGLIDQSILKKTPIAHISYSVINSAVLLGFGLMAVYSARDLICGIKSFIKRRGSEN